MSQQVFLVCPSTVNFHDPRFELIKQFYPHLSMEDPPDLTNLFHPAQIQSGPCSSSHQGRKYQDTGFTEITCRKHNKEKDKTWWKFIIWEDVKRWTRAELSLNLYRYKTH